MKYESKFELNEKGQKIYDAYEMMLKTDNKIMKEALEKLLVSMSTSSVVKNYAKYSLETFGDALRTQKTFLKNDASRMVEFVANSVDTDALKLMVVEDKRNVIMQKYIGIHRVDVPSLFGVDEKMANEMWKKGFIEMFVNTFVKRYVKKYADNFKASHSPDYIKDVKVSDAYCSLKGAKSTSGNYYDVCVNAVLTSDTLSSELVEEVSKFLNSIPEPFAILSNISIEKLGTI